MLSSAKIGRSSWRYYQRTVAGGACEYYAEHGDAPGRWLGSGLAELGLTPGEVVAEHELESLFGRGLSPKTGAVLGSAWRADAVTGYDLTFSAPKSVSALWALGDTGTMTAIDAAHAAAVSAALGYLEAHASMSRRGRDGVEQVVSAGFVAALFDHSTSRTGDPQLHTHALAVNKVHCTDGAWRTLDGHEIFHHKKSAGVIYQAALRAELTARLPVAFGPVSEHGQAEIAGVPEALLVTWSSRTSAVMSDAAPTIADAEQALGRPLSVGERARIIKTAVLATRPAKDVPTPEGDRRERWSGQAAASGWEPGSLTESVRIAHRVASRVRPAGDWERAVVTEAVTDAGRRKAIWSRADLTAVIAARIPTVGITCPTSAAETVALVDRLTDTALARVELSGAVDLGRQQTGVTARASDARYASVELVDTEARIVERAVSGGFHPASHLTREVLLAFYSGPAVDLSEEQRRAAVRLVASRDLVTVMTAPAGAGKTTTLAAAVSEWARQHTDVVALAPSARAAAELASATGAQGQTVARWLHTQANTPTRVKRPQDPGYFRREVILVDEASMLSTPDLDRLTSYVATHRAQLVLVGDPGQIGAVNAPGGMFEHLADKMAGQAIELTELHRFTNRWEAAATLRLRAGDPGVLDVYAERGRIHPEDSSEDAADAVFDRWHRATDTGRDALMLARGWTDVNALNARARAVAIATGTVTGPDLVTVATRSASTRGQVEARSWRAGDILLAKKNTTRVHIGSGTLRNGDRFRVLATAPHGGGLVVADLRGRGTTTLPTGYLAKHAEFGWAATIDGAQGATADVGIVLARSGLDREHLYVAMSRGRAENHVHTTPEGDAGDAGPHLHPPAPVEANPRSVRHRRQSESASGPKRSGGSTGSQLALPDVRTAVAQLARAVATSGRERAARSLLEAPVQASREQVWARAEAARPLRRLPVEHQRHQGDLTQARLDRDDARRRLDTLACQLCAAESDLDHVGFFARRRRAELTAVITLTQNSLGDALDQLDLAETRVTGLDATVDSDTTERRIDEEISRRQRHDAWAARGSSIDPDPNPHTGEHDPRRQPAGPVDVPASITFDHDPPQPGYGNDVRIGR